MDSDVLLKEASRDVCPGHREWLVAEPDIRPVYGFSVIAQNGLVHAIFRASALNAAETDLLLPLEAMEELERVLPTADDLRVYGH